MNINNLHIILYLSYECNLTCSYCVNIKNKKVISYENLDKIILFVSKYAVKFDNVFIEFIGGEPLLQEEKIKYILLSKLPLNVKFQITTNGITIDEKIYKKVLSKTNTVNLSYNENYFNNKNLFLNISKKILNKKNININFIFDPKKELLNIKENFLFVLKQGYKNINILPIVLVYNYSNDDFMKLFLFIKFIYKFNKQINLNLMYYIQEKNNHFEFTINPDGNILGDNMGTAENYFMVEKQLNNSIGKIGELSLIKIINKLQNYSYINYLKNIIKNGNTKQSYSNLLLLSNFLKTYNKKISITDGSYDQSLFKNIL